jgi:hypothetical protein
MGVCRLQYRRVFRLAVGVVVALLTHSSALAQRDVPQGTVLQDAPIFLYPDSTRQPLTMATANTVLDVVGTQGSWLNVWFQDSVYGRRVGFIEARFIRREPLARPAAAAASAPVAEAPRRPVLFISPMRDGFETDLSAAMTKKAVPVSVTANRELATLTLNVASSEEAGTAVAVVDRSGTVMWSYAVNKMRAAKNRRSMAEDIAKHLKNDYLNKR